MTRVMLKYAYNKISMSSHAEWTIVFYIEDNGGNPVDDFLSRLDTRTKAKFDWAIAQLQVRNITAREPPVKHIEGKLYELRVESQTNIFRLLYFFAAGRRIVFLHGFQKKTQKTPSREIAIAVKRMDRFSEREGGES
jgi:phage-related protein